MPARTYTIETRISAPQGSEIRTYLEEYVAVYSEVYRFMWREMTAPNYTQKYAKESQFVTFVCQKYGLLKRTVNSIKYEVKGRMNSYMELKKMEFKQVQIRIEEIERKISEILKELNRLKPIVTANQASEKQLERYRRQKRCLYFKKNKKNKLMQTEKNLKYVIENKKYKIGFGGKKIFGKQHRLKENGYHTHLAWYHEYVRNRDKNIYYLGSKDETAGNQMLQMSYDEEKKEFQIKIRKEQAWCTSKNKKENYLYLEGLKMNHMQGELCERIQDHSKKEGKQKPLSYRFHRRKKRWYLQVVFSVEYENYETWSQYGTIGLDYNDGFIELAETNESGNLIFQKHYPLVFHGTGKKAKTEIEQTISEIVCYAQRKGKDLIIEDLDFKKKKAKTSKGETGKNYNRMLHLFDYSRYKETMKNSCHRRKVYLNIINPYRTSKIGKQKYCNQKKLNIHQAAAFVIARKGQGYQDHYQKIV